MKVNYVEKEDTPEQIRIEKEKVYVGFQEVTCHLIFDVNMEFPIKDLMVANRAMAEVPLIITYSSIVSRYSVSLA